MRIVSAFLIIALVACEHPREAPATLTPGGSAASIAASSTASSTRPDSASATVALTASDTTPMQMPSGAELLKLIKRFPPDSFPDLPRAVRNTLEQRHCQVPQGGGAPHNVITGAFSAKAAVEWAVLCSVHDTSTIFVLNAATGAVVDSTGRTPDVNWIQGDTGNTWTYSQWLTVMAMSDLNAPADTTNEFSVDYSKIFPKPIDHDGIGQMFEGKGGEILYLAHGHWYSAGSGD